MELFYKLFNSIYYLFFKEIPVYLFFIHYNKNKEKRKKDKVVISKKATQPLYSIKVVLCDLKSYFILGKIHIFITLVFVKMFAKSVDKLMC